MSTSSLLLGGSTIICTTKGDKAKLLMLVAPGDITGLVGDCPGDISSLVGRGLPRCHWKSARRTPC